MRKINSISVFFPAFNDAKILPYLIVKMYSILPIVTNEFEVIIVDDGSCDDTYEVASLLSRYFPSLKVIRHEKNKGYGGALQSGFSSATKEWVFYTDGDGQYDSCELKELVKKATSHIDVVNGYKAERKDRWIRKIIGTVYNWTVHKMYNLPIADIDCDFRLIRRSLLKEITLTASSGLICVELIKNLEKRGARFAEVPVHHYPRIFGRSAFFTWRNVFSTFKEHLDFCRKSRSDNSIE